MQKLRIISDHYADEGNAGRAVTKGLEVRERFLHTSTRRDDITWLRARVN